MSWDVRRAASRAAVVTVLGLLGCGRVGYDPVADQVLVVAVPTDRLAGPATMTSPADLAPGTVGLSLREALTIAANHPGSDHIAFDPRGFPADRPIVIATESPLPDVTDDGTTIEATGDGVVIDGSAVAGPVLRIVADDVVVSGVSFHASGGDAVDLDGGSRVSLSDGTITDASARGIALATCSGVTISGMRLERSGAELITVTDCTDVTIHDNFMIIGDKNRLVGVHFERVTASRIVDNVIDPGEARLVNLVDSSDNVISRNVLDRGHAGVVLDGESHRNLVFENVVIGSEYDGLYVADSATGNTLVHNTLFQCSTPIVNGPADTVLGNNLVSDDPADFLHPPSYDFHLVRGSASIDLGTDLGFDCLPGLPERFLGAAPDLGAVESF